MARATYDDREEARQLLQLIADGGLHRSELDRLRKLREAVEHRRDDFARRETKRLQQLIDDAEAKAGDPHCLHQWLEDRAAKVLEADEEYDAKRRPGQLVWALGLAGRRDSRVRNENRQRWQRIADGELDARGPRRLHRRVRELAARVVAADDEPDAKKRPGALVKALGLTDRRDVYAELRDFIEKEWKACCESSRPRPVVRELRQQAGWRGLLRDCYAEDARLARNLLSMLVGEMIEAELTQIVDLGMEPPYSFEDALLRQFRCVQHRLSRTMKTQESSRPQRLLRRPEVIARTGLARTTLYLLERSGKFPQRRQLTPRVVAWVEAEVDQWVREREARGCPAPKARPSEVSA